MVSDEGQLASMNFDGSGVTYWNLDASDDLEGVVQITGRDEYLLIFISLSPPSPFFDQPRYIYLQQENSKTLLEFDVLSGVVVRSLPVRLVSTF
jgi:hypothetical protein